MFDKIYLYLCIAQGTGTVPIVSAHFRSLLYRNGWTDRAGFFARRLISTYICYARVVHGLGWPTGWVGSGPDIQNGPMDNSVLHRVARKLGKSKNIGKPTSLYGPLFQFLTNLAAVRRSTQRAVNWVLLAAALRRRRQMWIERRLLSIGQTDGRTDGHPTVAQTLLR